MRLIVPCSLLITLALAPVLAAQSGAPGPAPSPAATVEESTTSSDKTDTTSAPDESPRMTTTITVTARPSPVKMEVSPDVRTLPANSSIIDPGALERSSPREPAEVLRGLPGVDLAYYGQGGIPSGPSVRGYTDRNFGQDIAGFLDGIPLNLVGFVASHGALDLTPVFTSAVQRVDLVRGPLDARYGDFHRGASVNFVTRDGVARPSVTLAGGRFGTARGAVTYGNWKPDATSIYANIEGYRTGGYTDNQHVEHLKTFNRVYVPAGAGDLSFTFQGYWAEWEAPSYLDRDLVNSGALDEKTVVNPTDGGNQDNQLAYVRYRRGAQGASPWSATLHVSRRDWTRWRSDFLISPTQLQTQQVDERVIWGGRVEKTLGRAFLGRPSLFVAGVSYQHDDAETRQDATVERVSLRKTDDVDEVLQGLGLYAQEQWQATDWLKLMAGLRYSRVDYELEDNILAAGRYVPKYEADLLSPKAGLAVSLGKNLGLYANYATGMRSPTPRTEVRNSLTSLERVEIAKTESYEAGLTVRPSTRVEALLAVFRADNTNEIRGIPPGGTQFESLGASRREGWEAEVSVYPISRTRLFAGVSFVDAELTTATNPAANHLPDVADYVHKIGFETHRVREGSWPGTLSIAADLTLNGPKDLNTLGTIRAERYERVTASIAYTTKDRYRIWLGGFAYPGSRIAEAAFLFNQRVGVRANPKVSVEAGITYTF